MSMPALAGRPGTAVLPICSIAPTSHGARTWVSSSLSWRNKAGHSGSYEAISIAASAFMRLSSQSPGETRSLRPVVIACIILTYAHHDARLDDVAVSPYHADWADADSVAAARHLARGVHLHRS